MSSMFDLITQIGSDIIAGAIVLIVGGYAFFIGLAVVQRSIELFRSV
jgi:hypothetical protein